MKSYTKYEVVKILNDFACDICKWANEEEEKIQPSSSKADSNYYSGRCSGAYHVAVMVDELQKRIQYEEI